MMALEFQENHLVAFCASTVYIFKSTGKIRAGKRAVWARLTKSLKCRFTSIGAVQQLTKLATMESTLTS